MGREARATAQLSPAERQARKLARIGRGVRNLERLSEGLLGVPRGDLRPLLEAIRPHLTFPVSDAEWRWLYTKHGLTDDTPDGNTPLPQTQAIDLPR